MTRTLPYGIPLNSIEFYPYNRPSTGFPVEFEVERPDFVKWADLYDEANQTFKHPPVGLPGMMFFVYDLWTAYEPDTMKFKKEWLHNITISWTSGLDK
ncbi:hypothetical protein ABE142_02065 [Paenibacillus alvei]|uniref:hypothetical protein n=1 Tax=Paenibacillus alvei TaxID=44250 RepID=UPI003D27A97D